MNAVSALEGVTLLAEWTRAILVLVRLYLVRHLAVLRRRFPAVIGAVRVGVVVRLGLTLFAEEADSLDTLAAFLAGLLCLEKPRGILMDAH